MALQLTLFELATGYEKSWFGVIERESELWMVVQLSLSLDGRRIAGLVNRITPTVLPVPSKIHTRTPSPLPGSPGGERRGGSRHRYQTRLRA